LARGYFVEPLIVADLAADHWINRDELFLPVSSIVAVESLDEAIGLGNRSIYGLRAGLYSKEKKDIDMFFARAEAGILYVNRPGGATTTTWPGYQSVCGWKRSIIDGKGALGFTGLQRYMREQSQTILHS
jgi:1-pyrroline-5-carboxylate dehydrogenase